MKSLNLAEIRKESLEPEEAEGSAAAFLLVARLKQKLDEKETDIYEVYRL